MLPGTALGPEIHGEEAGAATAQSPAEQGPS